MLLGFVIVFTLDLAIIFAMGLKNNSKIGPVGM